MGRTRRGASAFTYVLRGSEAACCAVTGTFFVARGRNMMRRADCTDQSYQSSMLHVIGTPVDCVRLEKWSESECQPREKLEHWRPYVCSLPGRATAASRAAARSWSCARVDASCSSTTKHDTAYRIRISVGYTRLCCCSLHNGRTTASFNVQSQSLTQLAKAPSR
jgi:hypothetical protein